MATTIVTKKGSGAPAASDLVEGELAVDTTNGRLYTENSSAAVVELGSNPSGNITFGDNGKAIFGAGSDLQIYHDGNHSYIEDAGTGSIKIKVGDFRVENASGNNLIKGVGDVATLHHAGSEKLATTSTGVDVTGTVTATSNSDTDYNASTATINSVLSLRNTTAGAANNVGISLATETNGEVYITAVTNGDNDAAGLHFATRDSGARADRLIIASDGNVSIGHASPTAILDVRRGDASGKIAEFHQSTGYGIEIGSSQADAYISSGYAQDLQFKTGNTATTRMTITSSGNATFSNNVGIGRDPRVALDVAGEVAIAYNATYGLRFYNNAQDNWSSIGNTVTGISSANLVFKDASGEAMRLDGSSNLLLGKTTLEYASNAGHVLRNDGLISAVRSGGNVCNFNRLSSDGEVIQLNKDGVRFGSIGSINGSMYLSSPYGSDSGLRLSTNIIHPCTLTGDPRDAAIDLGYSAGGRWKNLHLSGAAYNGDGSASAPSISFGADTNTGFYRVGSDQIGFVTAGTIKAKLDASGNFLLGKTSLAIADEGIVFEKGGAAEFTTDAARVMRLNRTSDDGSILELNKDGTTVGSLGAVSDDAYIVTGDTGIRFNDGNNGIWPVNALGASRDAAIDLGNSGVRFKDLYRSGSTISTSDRNMKQDERDLTEAETRVAQACKGLLKAFRFIEAVQVDGDDARIHFGIIAQDLQAAFEAEGLDATKYAMFRPSTFTNDEGNEETRLGVCYENLLAFIIAAI